MFAKLPRVKNVVRPSLIENDDSIMWKKLSENVRNRHEETFASGETLGILLNNSSTEFSLWYSETIKGSSPCNNSGSSSSSSSSRSSSSSMSSSSMSSNSSTNRRETATACISDVSKIQADVFLYIGPRTISTFTIN
uniref:Uncharacterized protein n=1 Tax=Vespula pensylvanica TaxID=30213 RepID=A0A834KHP0_VESPE|nr:hypothetical protein H0235_014388 [Vespula pensylvanica]